MTHAHTQIEDTSRTEDRVRGPVCGMTVDPHTTPHHADHAGHESHFCSAGCRSKFVSDPGRYLGKEQQPASPEGAIWTCPMHPEVRQDHPGACPICGMALDPATVTADSGPSPEIADMTRRFWIGLVLSFPVLLLENGRPHFPCTSSCRVHGAFGPHPDGTGPAGGALGGLALFRAGLGIGANAQPQHVHTDRDGDGRRLGATAWSPHPRDRGTCQTFTRHELPNLCHDRIFFQPVPTLLCLLRTEQKIKFLGMHRKFQSDDSKALCASTV